MILRIASSSAPPGESRRARPPTAPIETIMGRAETRGARGRGTAPRCRPAHRRTPRRSTPRRAAYRTTCCASTSCPGTSGCRCRASAAPREAVPQQPDVSGRRPGCRPTAGATARRPRPRRPADGGPSAGSAGRSSGRRRSVARGDPQAGKAGQDPTEDQCGWPHAVSASIRCRSRTRGGRPPDRAVGVVVVNEQREAEPLDGSQSGCRLRIVELTPPARSAARGRPGRGRRRARPPGPRQPRCPRRYERHRAQAEQAGPGQRDGRGQPSFSARHSAPRLPARPVDQRDRHRRDDLPVDSGRVESTGCAPRHRQAGPGPTHGNSVDGHAACSPSTSNTGQRRSPWRREIRQPTADEVACTRCERAGAPPQLPGTPILRRLAQ